MPLKCTDLAELPLATANSYGCTSRTRRRRAYAASVMTSLTGPLTLGGCIILIPHGGSNTGNVHATRQRRSSPTSHPGNVANAAAHTNAPPRTAAQPSQPNIEDADTLSFEPNIEDADTPETSPRPSAEKTPSPAAPQQTMITSPPSAGLPDTTSRKDKPRRQTRMPTRFKEYAVARNLTTLWNSSCVSRHKNCGRGRTLTITRHFIIFTCY